ncbi:hypothetical protein [uncultured Adlercreutzia sp.]|uniref:hypothetical protein n=1 Tax=uncultured Adlercreutzia sp. TaxID=875803 RepID=UPI0025F7FC2D|nr:hypothetical protein [uncultured Adlercreutzia sp.]
MSTRTMESGKRRRAAAGRAALALVLALGLGLPVAAFGTGEGSATSFGEELSDVPGPAENAGALATAADEGAGSAGKAGSGTGTTGEADENAGVAGKTGGSAAPTGETDGAAGEGADAGLGDGASGEKEPARDGGSDNASAGGELATVDADGAPAAAPAGVQAAPLDAATTVKVGEQLYLKEQNGRTTYSTEAGGANPTVYTGPIALEFTGSSASVTVEGAANIVIAKDASLTGANGGPVFDFKSGASTLTIAEGADVSLTGADGYAAIRVIEGASLTLLGAGSLQVTGGDDSPAIGLGNYDYDSFGTVRLAMTGSLQLQGAGYAPAMGDIIGDGLSGMVEICAGSPELASGNSWDGSPINADRATVTGGNFVLPTQTDPELKGTYKTGPANEFAVTSVQLAGLPAGTDLTKAGLVIGDDAVFDPGFFAVGEDGTSTGYNVIGFNPLAEGAAPRVYLPASESVKAGAKVQFMLGDDLYDGVLETDGEGLKVTLLYFPKDYVETGEENPTVDISRAHEGIQLRNERGLQKQYWSDRLKGWVNYRGVLTITGTVNVSPLANAGIEVVSGSHTVNLRNTTISTSFIPAISVQSGASVEFVLFGSNKLETGEERYREALPTVYIAENATCTLSGKGKLTVSNTNRPDSHDEFSAATIGSGGSNRYGEASYANGGTFIMRSGTLEVETFMPLSPAIGAGCGATFESVIIAGGKLVTHGSWFPIGGGPQFSDRSSEGLVRSVLVTGGTLDMTDGPSFNECLFNKVESLVITGGSVIGPDGAIGQTAAQAVAAPLSAMAFDAPVSDSAVSLADDGGAVALAEEGSADVDADGVADADDGSSGIDDDFEGDFDDDFEGEADPAVPVNAFGEELVPVTFTGLPADTNLADIGFHIVNIDLNETERGLGDPVAVNEYGVYDVVTTDDGSMAFYLTNGQAYRRLVLAAWDGGTYAGMIAPDADGAMACAMRPTDATLFYEGHTFEDGWLCEDADIFWATDGSITGSEEGPALTAIRFATPIEGLTINYAADNGAGFGEMVASDDITGELMEPMVSLQASLSGEAAAGRGIEYRAYVQDAGWTPWARDGEATQASGDAPVLAVEARLTGGAADGSGATDGATGTTDSDGAGKDGAKADKLAATGDGASAMLAGALAAAAMAAALMAWAARCRRAGRLAPATRTAASQAASGPRRRANGLGAPERRR